MGSCAYPVKNVRDPITVEAYACLHGVNFTVDVGFGDVAFKGDSLTIVKKLHKIENDRLIIEGHINEIKGKTRNFRNIMFRHIPRGANEAAHAVAAWGTGSESPIFWVEEASIVSSQSF